VHEAHGAQELAALPEAAFDVVVGPPPADEAALAELARVLRGGGRWVTCLQPPEGLPDFAELLLEPREIAWYLGREIPGSACRDVARLEQAGFDIAGLKPAGPRAGAPAPGPALLRELRRAHPGRTNFAAGALEGLLVRRGRTIRIGIAAASAAGAAP